MRSTRMVFAAAVLALAGCAGAPVQNAPALAISGDEIQNYWIPVEETITAPLPSSMTTRSGRLRPMAAEVTVAYLIDSAGKVHDARIIQAVPENADAQWAVTAVSAYSYEPAVGNPERVPVRPTQTVKMGKAPEH